MYEDWFRPHVLPYHVRPLRGKHERLVLAAPAHGALVAGGVTTLLVVGVALGTRHLDVVVAFLGGLAEDGDGVEQTHVDHHFLMCATKR